MLGKIATAAPNGQFRTPRHIIRLMVKLTAPQPLDVICDPACGTAGFLIARASICASGIRSCWYLQFHPSPLKSSATAAMHEQDLSGLHRLLGSPANLGFRVVAMPLDPTPAFEALKGLDKHSPARSVQVKEALCRGPLFSFANPATARI